MTAPTMYCIAYDLANQWPLSSYSYFAYCPGKGEVCEPLSAVIMNSAPRFKRCCNITRNHQRASALSCRGTPMALPASRLVSQFLKGRFERLNCYCYSHQDGSISVASVFVRVLRDGHNTMFSIRALFIPLNTNLLEPLIIMRGTAVTYSIQYILCFRERCREQRQINRNNSAVIYMYHVQYSTNYTSYCLTCSM